MSCIFQSGLQPLYGRQMLWVPPRPSLALHYTLHYIVLYIYIYIIIYNIRRVQPGPTGCVGERGRPSLAHTHKSGSILHYLQAHITLYSMHITLYRIVRNIYIRYCMIQHNIFSQARLQPLHRLDVVGVNVQPRLRHPPHARRVAPEVAHLRLYHVI